MIEISPQAAPAGAVPEHAHDLELLVVEAGCTEPQYWRDLWRYRELFYFLAWRDVLVRYKQTAVGVAWAVLRPLLTAVVLAFVFGHVANIHTKGAPDIILVLCGAIVWFFFAGALTDSSNSLVSNANMISKVYFPRLIVPASTVLAGMVDFAASIAVLLLMMPFYHVPFGARLLLIPAFMLLAFIASLGAGLWFAALNVKYRDFRYIVPFVAQFGLYISPVGFASNHIHHYRLLYCLNPVVGAIDGIRWCVLGSSAPLYAPGLLASVACSGLILTLGLWYFRKTERAFADII